MQESGETARVPRESQEKERERERERQTESTRDLEGDGEVAEALSENPDDGVAEPGDDSDASDLGIDGARLTTLGLCGLGPGLAQSEDNVKEPAPAYHANT